MRYNSGYRIDTSVPGPNYFSPEMIMKQWTNNDGTISKLINYGWLNGPGADIQTVHFIFDRTGKYLIGSDTEPNDDPPPTLTPVPPASPPTTTGVSVSAIQNITQTNVVSPTSNKSHIWIMGGILVIGLIVLTSKK